MGNKAIANQRPTLEEIEFSKRAGTVYEAERRIINAGGFSLFQRTIDDPMFLDDLLKFHRTYVPSALGYAAFVKWLQDNKLERRLTGGGFEKQISQQETFYRKFYGRKFKIDRGKMFVDPKRLPAMKVGLEAGSVNFFMVKASPILSAAELQMTRALYFFMKIIQPLKSNGFKIWAENGTSRWTGLTLEDLLKRGVPVEPEAFNSEAFKQDWSAEEVRVITQAGPAPMITSGLVELVLTSDAMDIPANQIIINKDGKVVELDDRSYISAIAKNVRVISRDEEIILASQIFVKDKTYLAPNTWEWRRDVVSHGDKGTKPPVSVASAKSNDGELSLNSGGASSSGSLHRLRFAL